MTDQELRQTIADAVAAALLARGESSCPAKRRKHSWRRRLLLVLSVVGASAASLWYMHLEQLHEGVIVAIDGVVACSVDKFIFGIAEI